MSISTFPQSAHKLAMADLPLHGRPSQTVLDLGLAVGRMIVLALAFRGVAALGDFSMWPAVLASAGVLRLMLLVALTRAAFTCAVLCLAPFGQPRRSRAKHEILRAEGPI